MELLEAVLSSWFMIGRLGGFNAMNLQACSLKPFARSLQDITMSARLQTHACTASACTKGVSAQLHSLCMHACMRFTRLRRLACGRLTRAPMHACMGMQALYRGDEDTSFMEYDQEACESALQALFHDMGSLERQGAWCRCWSASSLKDVHRQQPTWAAAAACAACSTPTFAATIA